MVDAGRGAPGLVAGGPDDIAICVGQFPGCAQVVRMHMQSLALQRLGGGLFLRHEAIGLVKIELEACRVLTVFVLQGVFGQQAGCRPTGGG